MRHSLEIYNVENGVLAFRRDQTDSSSILAGRSISS
jgi:hypothetical protein